MCKCMSWDLSGISVEDRQVLKRSVTSPLKYYRTELCLMFWVCTTALGTVEHTVLSIQGTITGRRKKKKRAVYLNTKCGYMESVFWTEICLVSCDTLSFRSQSIGHLLSKLSSQRLRKKSNQLQAIKFRAGSECPNLRKLAKSLVYHLLQHAGQI